MTNNSTGTRNCFRFADLALASILISGWLGDSAQAQIPTPRIANTIANGQVIAELHATHALLHKANHDYDGFRAKAMHQISEAIHALEGGKGPVKIHRKPAGTGTTARVHEPQSVSDAQLAQAIQQLQTVQTQLTGNTSRHAATANTHITRAIADLQTALKIK